MSKTILSESFVAGEEVLYTQQNNEDEMINDTGYTRPNAGETINGATLPVPVFQGASLGSSEWYACDANDATKLEFQGFAISNSTDGNPIDIQLNGIVSGFTGLTYGVRYYVQDALGTIGIAPGTYAIEVGIAISATEILIIKGARFKCGNATKAINDTADQTITHNLGVIPRLIRIVAVGGQTNSSNICYGSGVSIATQSSVSISTVTGSGDVSTQSTTKILEIIDGDDVVIRQAEIKTITALTIVLQWNTNANAGYTTNLQWEVSA